MTQSMVSARIISCMIDGMKVPEADVFSPKRPIPMTGIKEFSINQKEAVNNMAIMRHTKRCAHMGCKLTWNKEEGTWDCPCHGSRFDRDGKLLDGPAVQSLDEK